MNSRSGVTPWVVGAALVAVAIGGVGWTGLISPELTAAAQTRQQVEDVERTNQELEERTAVLRAQYADIATYEAELAALQGQVPPAAETSALTRRVQELAEAKGVVVTDLAVPGATLVGEASAVDLPGAAPEQPAEGEEAASDAEASDAPDAESTDTAAPVPAVPTVVDGMSQIPLTISVLGPADAVRAFTAALRDEMPRLLLVQAYSLTAADEAGAADGRPATGVGDVEVTISAFAYTLADGRPGAEAPQEPTAPLPVPGANPFSPVSPGPLG